MLKVYIADDEAAVRQGLKRIINWEALGFELCGEASNGLVAYNDIKLLNPDLILVDIRMPKMQGLDMANKLREYGYKGHIIVLSGYSDFKYAQEAIRCNVDYYLTKPIDEIELEKAVRDIASLIGKRKSENASKNYYQKKARQTILKDIIIGEWVGISSAHINMSHLNILADRYQIVIVKSKTDTLDVCDSICKALKIPRKISNIDEIWIGEQHIVLLKGKLIIKRFDSFMHECNECEDLSYYIAVGNKVDSIKDIQLSYNEAVYVYEHLFFYDKDICIAQISDVKAPRRDPQTLDTLNSKEIGKAIYEMIVTYQKEQCYEYLKDIKDQFTELLGSAEETKNILVGAYLYIVQRFKRDYEDYNVEFLATAEIIQRFHSSLYLIDIVDFLIEEVERLMLIISSNNSDNIVEEIIEYINHHYNQDIKLKSLAPKFGYNSSYLGKIFSKKMDMTFNDYLHMLRINKAKELLLDDKYKIYEISAKIGYKNVDYFHLKFKHYENCTPKEYRRTNHIDTE